jgi:hypothetical protein
MTDRREYFGLDPNSLISMACPACPGMQGVRTQQDDYGNHHHFCRQCGCDLGSQAPDSFEPPEPFDS